MLPSGWFKPSERRATLRQRRVFEQSIQSNAAGLKAGIKKLQELRSQPGLLEKAFHLVDSECRRNAEETENTRRAGEQG